MRKPMLPLAALLSAAALATSACGGDDETSAAADSGKTTMEHSEAKGGAATETQAAELRAGLTSLLQEHVYLAGIAVNTGVGSGLDSKAFEAAAGTLDENSVALSKAVGSVYGEEAEKGFLDLWRQHIGFFVDYTKGLATKDREATAQAQAQLDGYRTDFANFLAKANPEIEADAVADSLQEHVNTLSAAIRAVVAESPKTFDRLQKAAEHMPMTAAYLSKAIAEDKGLS